MGPTLVPGARRYPMMMLFSLNPDTSSMKSRMESEILLEKKNIN